MVLEDDYFALGVLRAMLAGNGYDCVEAKTEQQAVDHFRSLGGSVKAMVVDVFLPECHGPAVAARIARERPDINFLFVSGTPVDAWPESDQEALAKLPAGRYSFLLKPFPRSVFIARLRKIMNPTQALW